MKLLLRPLKGCLGVILLITTAASLQAATAIFQQGANGYTGTADTDLNATEADRAQGNDPAVLVDQNAPIAHGLIRFDNIFGNGPGQVPPNATLLSATLTFVTSNVGDPIYGFRLLVPFNEATSTWNTMTNGVTIADGEMAETPDFTLDGNAVDQVDTLDVTATVQAWFDGTFPNYGWALTNSVGDGWQFYSSEDGTLTRRPSLTIVYDAPCNPLVIVTQPASTNVNELSSVTLSVAVGGTDPVFQWFKDGAPILDATNSTFTITRVRATDAGNYTVSIVNCANQVTSATAVLTVNADTTEPRILYAYGTNDNTTIFVVFSEIVTNAADAANYSVFLTSDPASQLAVATAAYGDPTATEGNVVVLTLDPNSPWVAPNAYSVTASAVFDLVGNPNDPAQVVPIQLYNDVKFGMDQTWTFLDPRADPPAGWNTRTFDDSNWARGPGLFGVEDTALAEPIRTPLTLGGITYYFRTHFNYSGTPGEGLFRFSTWLDDSAIIYLNGVEVTRRRMPDGPASYVTQGAGGAVGNAALEGPFTFVVTNLLAGDNVIAVEVHQIGTGSSDIVWGMSAGTLATSIEPVTIVTQPVGTNVTEPTPFSLRVAATGSSPRYQWFRNGEAIPGANGATYTVTSSDCDVHGGQYHVVVDNDAPSTITSATVTVNVACDVTPPAVTCVYGTNDVVVVQFTEDVTMDWNSSVFNFIIRPLGGGDALTTGSVTNTSGTNFGSTVLAMIDPSTPRDPNVAYQVEVSGVEDRFAIPVAPTTIPVPFHAAAVPLLTSTAQWRYNTTGTDLGTTWSATTYNDSTWALGSALFDAKRVTAGDPPRTNVNGIPVNTQTTLSNAANTAQIPTHYFRTHFNYSGSPSATLQLNAVVDDGSVWYLNGEEIFRNRMPSTPIAYGTLATGTVGDATNELFHVCVDNLVSGDNVLAVEVHQSALDSSDLTFGAAVSTYTATPPPPSARITLTRGTGGQINLSWTATGVVLQESSNLATHPNGWSNVAGVVGNSYQTTATTGNRFFRLAPAQ